MLMSIAKIIDAIRSALDGHGRSRVGKNSQLGSSHLPRDEHIVTILICPSILSRSCTRCSQNRPSSAEIEHTRLILRVARARSRQDAQANQDCHDMLAVRQMHETSPIANFFPTRDRPCPSRTDLIAFSQCSSVCVCEHRVLRCTETTKYVSFWTILSINIGKPLLTARL